MNGLMDRTNVLETIRLDPSNDQSCRARLSAAAQLPEWPYACALCHLTWLLAG